MYYNATSAVCLHLVGKLWFAIQPIYLLVVSLFYPASFLKEEEDDYVDDDNLFKQILKVVWTSFDTKIRSFRS